MATAKTKGVKPYSLLYPGESLGARTLIRGFLLALSAYGILLSFGEGGPMVLGALFWGFVFLLFLPYANLKFKERFGFELTLKLKIAVLVGILVLVVLLIELTETCCAPKPPVPAKDLQTGYPIT